MGKMDDKQLHHMGDRNTVRMTSHMPGHMCCIYCIGRFWIPE